MKLRIDSNQTVSVDSRGVVQFYHRTNTNTYHVLSMSYHQFLNFDDVMYGMKYLSRLTFFPLGGRISLYKKMNYVELQNHDKRIFFRFYPDGWKEYKNKCHSHILSFLHNVRPAKGDQSHARNDGESKGSSRRVVSNVQRRKQAVFRSARNVIDEDVSGSTQRANLSWRKSSNSRSNHRRRGGKHAARIRSEIEEAKADEEFSSVTIEDYEYGCEPEVVITN